jgi:hypothetical protein
MEGSEIALLRQRLVQEYEAGRWALYGLNSGTAQHAFITARFRQMETSIDQAYIDQIVPFLEAHGTQVEPLHSGRYLARLPGRGEEEREYTAYRLTFPEGSRRFDRLRTSYLVPFTIYFPDGATIDGQDRYALNIAQQDQTVLGVPASVTRATSSSVLAREIQETYGE